MNTLLLVGRGVAEALDLARLSAEDAVERRADEVLASLGGVALSTSGLEQTEVRDQSSKRQRAGSSRHESMHYIRVTYPAPFFASPSLKPIFEDRRKSKREVDPVAMIERESPIAVRKWIESGADSEKFSKGSGQIARRKEKWS